MQQAKMPSAMLANSHKTVQELFEDLHFVANIIVSLDPLHLRCAQNPLFRQFVGRRRRRR